MPETDAQTFIGLLGELNANYPEVILDLFDDRAWLATVIDWTEKYADKLQNFFVAKNDPEKLFAIYIIVMLRAALAQQRRSPIRATKELGDR